MIHIDLDNTAPDAAWIALADAVNAELMQTGLSKARRAKIIDDNDGLWRKLEPWLKNLSRGKCWYSEARNCASYWHVDHFRPKKELKDLDGEVYEGYWWLAFEWRNYRLAGSALNVPKSTKFPVRDGTDWACSPADDCDDEFPYLLDPICPEDPSLLSFNDQGKAMAAEPNDDWHRRRAEVSIDILNLNYDSLKRGRKRVWDLCKRHSDEVLYLKDTLEAMASRAKKQKLRDLVKQLRDMVSQEAEFSATAAACVRARGSKWLERVVFGR